MPGAVSLTPLPRLPVRTRLCPCPCGWTSQARRTKSAACCPPGSPADGRRRKKQGKAKLSQVNWTRPRVARPHLPRANSIKLLVGWPRLGAVQSRVHLQLLVAPPRMCPGLLRALWVIFPILGSRLGPRSSVAILRELRVVSCVIFSSHLEALLTDHVSTSRSSVRDWTDGRWGR